MLAELPAILGRMEKGSVGKGPAKSSVRTREIRASGGASVVMAAIKSCSLSFGPAAVMTTPSPVLVTVPVIPKRQAKL